MLNKRTIFLLLAGFAGLALRAQDVSVIEKYIAAYKDLAISEMQRTGVPASIKLAQGIHETMAGTSILVNKSNNHFGIKCKSTWTGESVAHDDDAKGECFRKYPRAEDSYRDHSDFLRGNQRYASLFTLDPEDYKGWAYGLKKAGYATNPKYPVLIVKLIEDYHLQDYTLIALGKMPGGETMLARQDVPVREETTGMVTNALATEPVRPVRDDYPSTVFKINDTKVIYARKGTSFLAIAYEHDIPLKRLFEFNDDMPEAEEVEYDQLIFLQRKRKTSHNELHLVQPGETIYDIAQTEAIRLESLLAFNHLDESQDPAAGELLYLRKAAPSRPRLALPGNSNASVAPAIVPSYASQPSVKSTGSYVTHIVQPKETLYSISRKYNVKAEDIAQWNQLPVSGLKTGQTIKIYK